MVREIHFLYKSIEVLKGPAQAKITKKSVILI